MDDPDLKVLLGAIILIVFGVIGWTYRDELFPSEAPVPAVEPPVPAEIGAEVDTGPKHPIPVPRADAAKTRQLVPLPPLEDSDAYFLLEIGTTLGPVIESLLVREAVIDRLVTTIDNLPRMRVSEKIRPVGRLAQAFRPDAFDDVFTLGPANFSRYDDLVAQIAGADIDAITDLYQRFYPLFQQSYERLGYPDAYFNDRLIDVIDHLLETPAPNEPIRLVRPNVLYEFADPTLESLSSGQKLLVRMGPANAATVKGILIEFRSQLAARPD
jgi:hypothetical protein